MSTPRKKGSSYDCFAFHKGGNYDCLPSITVSFHKGTLAFLESDDKKEVEKEKGVVLLLLETL